MDEEAVVKFVETYLKKKGFKQAELAFHEEIQQQNNSNNAVNIHSDPDLSTLLHSLSQPEDSPARYQDEYSKLRTWAYSSLDLYKHELLRVLYPVFVHCYMDIVAKGHIQDDHKMMHSRDLQKLEGVLSPSHLEEMEFAHTLRQSKVNIKICQYSDELIMQYLRKSKSSIILGIVNEHINFQVSPGQPISISDDPDAVTLIGSSQDAANQINKKEIHWGLLEDSLEERFEKTGGFLSDSEKTEGETKEGDMDENKKRSMDGGKQASIKKSKKDKAASATAKAVRLEANTVPAAPRVKPSFLCQQADVEQSILEDLRNRVQLSSATLPSVSFYTFINTHNSLNCSSISHDGSLVAGGFSDSSLKVWDMAKLGQQAGNSILQDENDAAPSEHVSGPNSGKRSYTLFRVIQALFIQPLLAPLEIFFVFFSRYDRYFLLDFHFTFISSACLNALVNVRLWSTELNANLVCYKGHNYPVWDVQPYGHYFASASHDRTARIWSCVQWHANCNYIATGSSDKTVRLWDVQSGECVRIFIGHRSMILSLAMSPDGRYMASGDEDGTIMMWDLSSGRCISPLMGHHSCVWSLAFSCESSLLASGSADCTVKLWDVTTSTKPAKKEENKTGNTHRMRLLKTLPTKSTPVSTLRFSRRNLLFAAGALSKSQ
ncbi:transcription initiation factor TFIID [Salix suchowensis]|nr:transcription initiation factor TFIID [Salix suchowensis]